jgi:hypothetical protein
MDESPAGGAVGLSAITLSARSSVDRGDGKIAAYAINRHLHFIDAKPHHCLPMEADRIALAIFWQLQMMRFATSSCTLSKCAKCRSE